eukprot:gene4230-4934_t
MLQNDPYEKTIDPDTYVDASEMQDIDTEDVDFIVNKPMALDRDARAATILERSRKSLDIRFAADHDAAYERELNPRHPNPQQLGIDEYETRGPIAAPAADERFQQQFLQEDWASLEFDGEEDEEEVDLDDEDNYAELDSGAFEPYRPARPLPRVENIYNGVAHGYSKRKDAAAVALIRLGQGELLINGRTLSEYFGNCVAYKDTVLRPLVITETIVKWDIEIRVQGGGIKGQAEAICRALALAISNYDLGYRMALRFSGLLKHDIRRVERKKPGQLKARKKFPLVKR